MSGEESRKSARPDAANSLPPDAILFGRSEAMKEVRRRATKIAGTGVPVLLYGPNGSGKEVLARWIHNHSKVSNAQFVKVNCAAIPRALLESELFGYEKGAFTGAHVSKPGSAELAQNGTLLLDQIADLDWGLQAKLLQFLQDGSFSRIGGAEEKSIRTRLICTTNKDLQREIEAGRFRADRYYRINVVRMCLPPLRERSEDIPLLAECFLAQFQQKFGKSAEPLNKGMLQYLQNLDWPGNICELSSGIARHVLLGAEAGIDPKPVASPLDLVAPNLNTKGNVPLKQLSKQAIRDRERAFILETLKANQWNRRKSAEALKISYRTLIYKIRESGLPSKFPPELDKRGRFERCTAASV